MVTVKGVNDDVVSRFFLCHKLNKMPLSEKELALRNVLKDNLQMYISMLYAVMIGFGIKWYLSPNSDTIPIFITAFLIAVLFHLIKAFIKMPSLRVAYVMAVIVMYGIMLFLLLFKGIFSLLTNGFGANLGTAISTAITLYSFYSLKMIRTMSNSLQRFDT